MPQPEKPYRVPRYSPWPFSQPAANASAVLLDLHPTMCDNGGGSSHPIAPLDPPAPSPTADVTSPLDPLASSSSGANPGELIEDFRAITTLLAAFHKQRYCEPDKLSEVSAAPSDEGIGLDEG